MFDLSPLHRSTVGFDRLFSLLDSAANADASAPSFPPYNIERRGEDEYRITMAVAGFGEDDISIEMKQGSLRVTGKRTEANKEEDSKLLYHGIAARSFERRFQLADYVEVTGASLENGLLHLDLKREIPEAMKPRTIEISGANGKSKSKKQIEGKAA